jgi:hypothetical protein
MIPPISGHSLRERLTRRRAGADGDAVRPVVADHPAPQRVVKVEHQHLLARAFAARQTARNGAR